MYRFVDAAVVRVAALPSGVEVPPWPDLAGVTSEHVAQWRCWLEQVWAQDAFASAVEVAMRAIPNGEHIATAWARRRAALTTYRDTLTASGQTAPEVVLPDLLHLHHVRMIGICPDTERACARLARAAALSWITRTHAAP